MLSSDRHTVRSHRLGGVSASIIALLLIGGTLVTSVGWLRAEASLDEAHDARVDAERARDQADQARIEADAQRMQAQVARVAAELEAAKSATVVTFMVDTLGSPDPALDGADVRVLDALRRAESRLSETFADFPGVETSLRRVLGNLYGNLGAAEEAERHLAQALSLSLAGKGSADPATQLIRALHADVLSILGRQHEAESALIEAHNALSEALGDQHADTLMAKGLLALHFQRSNKLDEAEALLRELVDLSYFTHGGDARPTLVAQQNLGTLLLQMGRLDDARAVLGPTLGLMRTTLGVEDPMTLTVMGNLAMLHVQQGRLAEGAVLLQESIDGRRRVLPLEHPDLLLAIGNLASIYSIDNQVARAAEMFREVIDARDRAQVPLDPYTTMIHANYTTCLNVLGEVEPMEAMIDKILGLGIGNAAQNSAIVSPLLKLGDALRQWGRDDLAEQIFREMWTAYRRLMPSHANATLSRDRLAATLRTMGRDDEAAALSDAAGE